MKISNFTFENYRPNNIGLKCDAHRLVCWCQCHINIDYLQKLLNISLARGVPRVFETLVYRF